MEIASTELTQKILSLSLDEQVILAQQLWDSLEHYSDSAIEEGWLTEADKRWKEIEEGKVQCIPAKKSISAARASLEK